MNILAVESSTQACSASLKIGDGFYTEFELAPQKHANILLTQIENVLNKANISADQIDFLAFGEGPGAFTGVRIAAGVIQGLAYGWKIPVIAVSSLEAMGLKVLSNDPLRPVISCLDARMNEVYTQLCWIEKNRLCSEPPLLLGEAAFIDYQARLSASSGVGDIAQEYPKLKSLYSNWHDAYPSAQEIAEIASQRIELAANVEQKVPVPVYLRNNIADKKQPV